MPIIKSAKKRVRVTRKATVRNVKTKRSLRSAVKIFSTSLGSSKASDAHKKVQSALDKTAKKGIMHKNKVARKQRQLAAKAKAAGMKTTATKKAAPKKATVKKPAAKKAPSKKTTKK